MIRTFLMVAATAWAPSAFAYPPTDMHPGDSPLDMTAATRDAATPTSPPEVADPAVTAMGPDARLLTELHGSNLAEIQEGQLAETMATSDKVRNYAKTLVDDHNNADLMVAQEASRLGITLSDTLPTAQQADVDALKATTIEDFDRTFVRAEVTGHAKVIADVEGARDGLTDKGVRQLADKVLRTLRKHEREAQSMDRAMAKSS